MVLFGLVLATRTVMQPNPQQPLQRKGYMLFVWLAAQRVINQREQLLLAGGWEPRSMGPDRFTP
jgi:hypothetical protein